MKKIIKRLIKAAVPSVYRVPLKKVYHKLSRKPIITTQVQCEKLWLGDPKEISYGGFFICPDQIDSNSIIYSAGIGLDVTFEKDLINRFGCKIFGFDPTPRAIHFMESQPVDKLTFFPYGLHNKDGEASFHLPKDQEKYVSGSISKMGHLNENTVRVPMKRISTIMKELNHTHIDILKMDIEGAEYDVIEDIVESNLVIKQITLEFHHWLRPFTNKQTKDAIQILNKAGFYIFGISPSELEVSFIRKDR